MNARSPAYLGGVRSLFLFWGLVHSSLLSSAPSSPGPQFKLSKSPVSPDLECKFPEGKDLCPIPALYPPGPGPAVSAWTLNWFIHGRVSLVGGSVLKGGNTPVNTI